MKITKFEHACLVVEEAGSKLIIDPGIFSPSCSEFANVVSVVVTHVHPDHFDPEKLNRIVQQNPDVMIFTVQTVADELKGSLPITDVSDGQIITSGSFVLEFLGTAHALIHASIPLTKNTGVMVNSRLYYPGDALTLPHQPVDILAVPASGPWLKSDAAMDFIAAVKPKQAFPSHDALLSDIGTLVHYPLLEKACVSVGAKYLTLKPCESLVIT